MQIFENVFLLDVFFDFFGIATNETPTFESENDRGGGMSDRPSLNGEGEEYTNKE